MEPRTAAIIEVLGRLPRELLRDDLLRLLLEAEVEVVVLLLRWLCMEAAAGVKGGGATMEGNAEVAVLVVAALVVVVLAEETLLLLPFVGENVGGEATALRVGERALRVGERGLIEGERTLVDGESVRGGDLGALLPLSSSMEAPSSNLVAEADAGSGGERGGETASRGAMIDCLIASNKIEYDGMQ